jgi:phospholipid/cholesterol/gamma-HCH transport system substrate-binding protein
MTAETKVGMFFVVGMGVLAWLTFKVEHVEDLFAKQYPLKAYFSSANGLEAGSAITLAGVKVGKVKAVTIEGDRIAAHMLIDRGQVVRSDAVASITMGGLLGNKFIDITLGSTSADPLPPGSVVKSVDAPDVNSLLRKVEAAVGNIQDLTGSFEGSKDFFKSLKEAGPKLNQVLGSLQEITDKIKKGEGTVGKLVADDSLYKQAQEIAASLRTASEKLAKILGENEADIRGTMTAIKDVAPQFKEAVANLTSIAKKIEKGEGTIGKLVNDPTLYEDLKKAMSNIQTLVAKVEKGEGTLGKFMSDDTFYKDARDAVANLKSVAAKIDQGEGTIGKLVNDPTLFDELKKVVLEGREAVRGAKEQIPIGAFTSVLFSAF